MYTEREDFFFSWDYNVSIEAENPDEVLWFWGAAQEDSRMTLDNISFENTTQFSWPLPIESSHQTVADGKAWCRSSPIYLHVFQLHDFFHS